MADTTLPDAMTIGSFMQALHNKLKDSRDNRGKRHQLAFVVAAVLLSILSGRQKVSSIHRFMCHKLLWLRQVTGIANATCLSRAHLPRLLECIDWGELSSLIAHYFHLRRDPTVPLGWVALDGKALRGSRAGDERQSVVLAVRHDTTEEVACARQSGEKSSEIPIVRELLKSSRLESEKVTLDALHCNPDTTAQIAKAGGTYLVQVKENQPVLREACQFQLDFILPRARMSTTEKGHGRITTWESKLLTMQPDVLDTRWCESAIQTLVMIRRETFHMVKHHTTVETSFYISNATVADDPIRQLEELSTAVRRHWQVEANNYVRDVTLGEDGVKTKSGNQAQVMANLRTCAIGMLREVTCGNLKATIERLADIPAAMEALLRKVQFL
jgi:predicted transposase YbfD/YdcC